VCSGGPRNDPVVARQPAQNATSPTASLILPGSLGLSVTDNPKSAGKILEHRTVLRARYGSLYDEVLRIVTRHDPIEIAQLPDDYEPEVDTILLRLEGARSASDARRILHQEFVQWFSIGLAGPEENFEKMAREVWDAWGRHRSSPRKRATS